ncbi:MAG: tRNA uridine-5-carboxymethylaminomethyl(34) synthesis GTPase MnmE [Hyphomicrobiaceae bacterium]
MSNRETIFALSSAPGRAGVAVVRVSGPGTVGAITKMAGPLPPPRSMSYRAIRDVGMNAVIDRGLVVWFSGPASFTGEDSAEFHIHGGRAVIARLLSALGRLQGFRMAEAGEFATRAFHSGKIDLAEAEGLADLIDAETEAQRLQALRQADGVLSKIYEGWRTELITAGALIEAAIDFSDEADVSEKSVVEAVEIVKRLSEEIANHLDDGRRGEILREGFRVVLAGPVNSGKSSFLNWLSKRDAAIVSEEPGTTRDVVEIKLDLEGLPIIVSDTAGFRETKGVVEREGIRRSRLQMNKADLVIWMMPANREMALPKDRSSNDRQLLVASKADLVDGSSGFYLSDKKAKLISLKNGLGLEELRQEIIEIASKRIGTTESPALTQAHHRNKLEICLERLTGFLSADQSDTELRAEDLRLAANALGRITGRVDAEDLLDQIFGRFCIGK